MDFINDIKELKINGEDLKEDPRGDYMFLPLKQKEDKNGERIYTCEICPIRLFCGDNNEFDCDVYGMFKCIKE